MRMIHTALLALAISFPAAAQYPDVDWADVFGVLHQLTGVTSISVYPYQLGHENEEAIQSGAFWFYRKLGFRPGRPDLLALAQKEERKIAADPTHRTSPQTLRKLAAGHAFYEMEGQRPGRWDTFSTRNLGFAVERSMATKYHGDPEAMRIETRARMEQLLDVDRASWGAAEQTAFENFALVLMLVPDIQNWTSVEKRALVDIIRAKAAPNEADYLHLLQRHDSFREAVLRLGSSPVADQYSVEPLPAITSTSPTVARSSTGSGFCSFSKKSSALIVCSPGRM